MLNEDELIVCQQYVHSVGADESFYALSQLESRRLALGLEPIQFATFENCCQARAGIEDAIPSLREPLLPPSGSVSAAAIVSVSGSSTPSTTSSRNRAPDKVPAPARAPVPNLLIPTDCLQRHLCTHADIEEAADSLLRFIDSQEQVSDAISASVSFAYHLPIDVEWDRNARVTDRLPVSVLSIAIDGEIFVLHLAGALRRSRAKGLSNIFPKLKSLVSDVRVILVGRNVGGDASRLQAAFRLPSRPRVFELGLACRQVNLVQSGSVSLQKLLLST